MQIKIEWKIITPDIIQVSISWKHGWTCLFQISTILNSSASKEFWKLLGCYIRIGIDPPNFPGERTKLFSCMLLRGPCFNARKLCANIPWLAGHVTVAVFPGGNVGFSGSTTGFPRQSVAMKQPTYVRAVLVLPVADWAREDCNWKSSKHLWLSRREVGKLNPCNQDNRTTFHYEVRLISNTRFQFWRSS